MLATVIAATLALQAVPPSESPELSVYFYPAVMRQWSYLYENFKGKEFLQCMYGSAKPDSTSTLFNVDVTIAVNANLPPSQLRRSSAGVKDSTDLRTNWCPWKFQTWPLLGMAHSHLKTPKGERLCMVSQDDYTLQLDRQYFLNVVVCDVDRFIVYTQFTGLTGVVCRFDPEAEVPDCLDGVSEGLRSPTPWPRE